MTARFIVADVFDGLATLEDGSVDLVVTSPPFLALRSYLPADHPDKAKEMGSEPTPAAFIDSLLAVTAELRRVLAPHGSICVELGDTYAGSGGGGGDYLENGWREGQQQFAGSGASMRESNAAHWRQKNQAKEAWPLAKSLSLIPETYRFALAYGLNPHTGQPSPAGKWRIRNVIRWVRPNPPVGALGDKWRPATSELVVATVSGKRFWDDLATRKPHTEHSLKYYVDGADYLTRLQADETRHAAKGKTPGRADGGFMQSAGVNPSGAPLLDWWEIPPGGYQGAHYAVFPPELVEPCVKAMCPTRVCVVCGEPSRRIVGKPSYVDGNGQRVEPEVWKSGISDGMGAHSHKQVTATRVDDTVGFSDCGHDSWRTGRVLDPFAGSGTTLLVAEALGYEAIGIDIDGRNRTLWEKRRDDRAFTLRRQAELF